MKKKLVKWRQGRCDWCRRDFRCARSDAAFCSAKCRLRMHTFYKQFGYRPQVMGANITAQAAADLEVLRLIRAERARIEAKENWLKSATTPTVK